MEGRFRDAGAPDTRAATVTLKLASGSGDIPVTGVTAALPNYPRWTWRTVTIDGLPGTGVGRHDSPPEIYASLAGSRGSVDEVWIDLLCEPDLRKQFKAQGMSESEFALLGRNVDRFEHSADDLAAQGGCGGGGGRRG